MMSQKLESVKLALQRRGLSVISIKNDQFNFYRAISQELWGSVDHPKSARKEIYEYQEEKEFLYFQLFLPYRASENSSHDKTLRNLLKEDLESKPRCPTERDLYACAEKLKLDIYVYSKSDEQSQWVWFRFAPILVKTNESSDRYLMFLRYQLPDGKYDFAKIDKVGKQNKSPDERGDASSSNHQLPDFLRPDNFPHALCYTFRFSFENVWSRDMQNTCIQHYQSVPEVGNRDTENWDREFLENDNSLFRCISKELYDTDGYYNLIRAAICEFQLHDDYIDVFSQFIDMPSGSTETQRQKRFKEHIIEVKKGKNPGKGEIFAAASLLHVPVYVYTISDKWEIFPPLTSSREGTVSYVSLLQSAANRYERLVPRNKHCNCEVIPPRINGNVKKLSQDISGVILDTVAKDEICCPPGKRRERHTHLNHVAEQIGMEDSVRIEEKRYEYIFPGETTGQVISLLEEEGRKLNQISEGGGTLYDCLSKEIFGDEHQSQRIRENMKSGCRTETLGEMEELDPTDVSLEVISDSTDRLLELHGTNIETASIWLGVPIYVFTEIGESGSGRFTWKRFMTSEDHPKCRFYVTLYYNSAENVFDRVVPLKGCNCRLLPPISIFQDQCQELSGSGEFNSAKDPHEPMVEFLLDQLPDEKFSRQDRNIPVSHVYTDTYKVMKRPDMSNRVIDQVGLDSHSFYRCVSKEIFGTENFFIFIRQIVCDEMKQKSGMYREFLADHLHERHILRSIEERQKQRELEKQIQKVQNDFEADDFEILAAATVFQTPFYILRMEVDSSTRWIEYTKLRRKKKPDTYPKRTSKCRQLGTSDKYYVTLIRTSAGHYDRIVPASEVCNCLISKPVPPSEKQFSYPSMSENEIHSLTLMREVESCLCRLNIALNNWLMTNVSMQTLCETIANELEGNREKVNYATIAGSATGMVGAALAIAGLIAGPVTFGASLGLTIAGGVVGGVGGVTTISAKITEAVLVKKTLAQLTFTQAMLKERSDELKETVTKLHDKIKDLDDANSLIQSGGVDAFDKSILQSLGAIVRAAKEFYVIPLAMLRFSIRGATVASAVLGPLTLVLDIGFMAYSIWNLTKGSKTDVSENLRRISSILQASRIQMSVWANGNLKR